MANLSKVLCVYEYTGAGDRRVKLKEGGGAAAKIVSYSWRLFSEFLGQFLVFENRSVVLGHYEGSVFCSLREGVYTFTFFLRVLDRLVFLYQFASKDADYESNPRWRAKRRLLVRLTVPMIYLEALRFFVALEKKAMEKEPCNGVVVKVED
jgi:hypothetical protein